ncbi:NAD(P)-dependent oxidoreductase, partial [Acinetobacter baumannii]
MDIFPISLKLQQQRCLIVGGGHIALRKATLLAKAGAIIDVVAPAI